ncbi:MAG: mRNA surveillance protein pelota [Candidatus ainarchaeum sp.]|nr:mRNA surveillance protein pelota [Candidatus ainarchaeum sp.]
MKYFVHKKEQNVVITPENLDDLWALNNITHENELIYGKTTRRFRVEGSKDSEKKTVNVKIKIEKKEFDTQDGRLKFTGIIIDGHPEEYVDVGSFHTLDIGFGDTVTIYKELLGYELDLIESAKKYTLNPKIIAVVLDDETATVSEINYSNYKVVAKVNSKNKGKRYAVEEDKNYFKEILESISNTKPEMLILAGPGFDKDKLGLYLKEKNLKLKTIFVNLNGVGTNGILELIKSNSLSKTLNEFKISKDIEKVNNSLYKISQGKRNIIYGPKDVQSVLENQMVAVEELTVSTNYFNENYSTLKPHFVTISNQGKKIHLIDSKNDAGKMLDGLGGILLNLFYSL